MQCDRIIVEVNTGQPSFEGIHDIIVCKNPPNREPIPITSAGHRVRSEERRVGKEC